MYEWIIGLIVAVIALFFSARSFYRLRKTEQIRLAESIMKDVRNSINEYYIITSKPPSNAEQFPKYLQRMNLFLGNALETLNWYCKLVEIGEIKDKDIGDYSKRILIKWHDEFFVKEVGVEILSGDKYPSYKKVYQMFKNEYDESNAAESSISSKYYNAPKL